MVLRSKYPILFGLAFGIATGVYVSISYKNESLALVLGISCFLLGTTVSYLRLSTPVNKVEDQPAFRHNLKSSKEVIYRGPANHYIENTSISGTLYLLRDKLIFQTGFLNSRQKHEVVMFLNDIKEVSFAKTYHVLDKIIVIVTNTGDERFLVKGNQLWIDEIENALHHNALLNRQGKAV